MSTAPPNSRASLLAGLRTGGVRSTSGGIPHTAAPGATFNIGAPRFASQSNVFPEEDDDQVLELPSQNMFANVHHGGNRNIPMTAAVDGPNNRFLSQQQRGMNPNSLPFSPGFANPQVQAQAQALQLQMMQMELMKIQAQQYQAEVLAQAQRQQAVQPPVLNKRPSLTFNPPATAGPLSTSFDLRTAALSAQMRRATQADPGRGEDPIPMTAALGGKFGSRPPTGPINGPMRFNADEDAPAAHSTTVISGGTSLGSPAAHTLTFNSLNSAPSKSDTVSSWRRGGSKGNSVLSGNRPTLASPSVKITPPPLDRISPPPSEHTPAADDTPTTATPTAPAASGPKFRPQPLRFAAAVSQPLPVVAVDSGDAVDVDDSSSNDSFRSTSNSSPTTPRSSSSLEMPLSPREEASKRLYEGLGIGRPSSSISNGNEGVNVPIIRAVSQPLRQPRGPPSGMEELGPKNFATRIRRKAIGGLGMLIGARERREFVEAY